jgi:hypothetical protein
VYDSARNRSEGPRIYCEAAQTCRVHPAFLFCLCRAVEERTGGGPRLIGTDPHGTTRRRSESKEGLGVDRGFQARV